MNNKIYIYLSDLAAFENAGRRESFIAENLRKLPAFRRSRCNEYKSASKKTACIISYLLLEKGLNERFGITDFFSFIYNGNGKPYLKEHPRVFFSISHCKNAVVCVLADFEVGADIEILRNFNIKTACRVCGENELKLLSEASNPDELFCKMWTRKESYAKAKGMSVTSEFKSERDGKNFYCLQNERYILSVYPKPEKAEIITEFADYPKTAEQLSAL